ncbi:Retinol dehydrogenase 11 [Astathelohania contejeani]|uniref:Retinol dehydrogenase 11 n=1 Tax=Astathelohania contejeani TaxID=164912 RepID=A0ABQ7HYQ9_9MICR|nr:Retinol dehydrogenase 11 [Thelohania contejeani]
MSRLLFQISNLPLGYTIKLPLIGLAESYRNIAKRFKSNIPFNIKEGNGEIICVTGGNKGIGKEVTKILVEHGYTVYILARDEESSRKTMEECESLRGGCHYVHLDLADMGSINEVIQRFDGRKIRALINNAGILDNSNKMLVGQDLNFMVNYLGHYALTAGLIPQLKGGRIVCVTSCALFGINGFFPRKKGNFMKKYSESKLCNALHSLYLKSEIGIESVAVHPGTIRSGLFDDSWYGYFVKIISTIFPFILDSTKEGAEAVVNACFTTDISNDKNTIDLFISKERGIPPKYLNIKNARKLNDYSLKLIEK